MMAVEITGRIMKGIGGFYYVDTADGCFECRARGIFRKEGITPLVGDRVQITVREDGSGSIDVIEPRRSILLRPPVANVTQMAVVVATANPKPNLLLLDKLIASAELAGIKPLICFNKVDLSQGDQLLECYQGAGFDVLGLSAATDVNVDILADRLRDEITVFAGNSGVGKSSLLNSLTGSDYFVTGEVSSRVERGKHTTRHSELVALPSGGYIIDTPGFGSLDMAQLEVFDCAALFREFAPYTKHCLFRDCSHRMEKGCAILEAVEAGDISLSRHESYRRLYDEWEAAQRERKNGGRGGSKGMR